LVFVRFGYSAASNTFGLVTPRSPRRLGDPKITPELTGLRKAEAQAKSYSGPWIRVKPKQHPGAVHVCYSAEAKQLGAQPDSLYGLPRFVSM
jgi:hypothetical protein